MEGKGTGIPLKRWLPMALLGLMGMAGGFLYYRYIGCATGTCPITSNPYISTLYGGVIGLLLGNVITHEKKMEEDKENG